MFKVLFENKGNVNGQVSDEQKELGNFTEFADAFKFAKRQARKYAGTAFFATVIIRREDGQAVGSISTIHEPINLPKGKHKEYEYTSFNGGHPDEPKLDKKFWY